MKAKTQTMEALLKTYKALSVALIVTNTCLGVLLSKWISPNTSTLRFVLYIISTSLISGGIMSTANKVWLKAHNDLLERDVYAIQQALSNKGRIDADELDFMIQALTKIKEAVPPNEQKKD